MFDAEVVGRVSLANVEKRLGPRDAPEIEMNWRLRDEGAGDGVRIERLGSRGPLRRDEYSGFTFETNTHRPQIDTHRHMYGSH